MHGNCDVMALALHRLTGKPMGLWSGKFIDEDSDDGIGFEYCHACIILGDDKWMDVNGIGHDIPGGLYFNMPITEVVLIPSTELEIRDAFTCCEIDEESIQAAMDFALSYQPLSNCVKSIMAIDKKQEIIAINAAVVIDGVERPVVNSLGNLIHQNSESVRQFWRSMGGSSVVDDKGRPIVMVHGTFHNIKEFEGAVWFASVHDTSAADIIVSEGQAIPNSDPEHYPDVGEGAVFYPVYLKLEMPAPDDIAAAFYDGDITVAEIKALGFDGLVWDDGVRVVFDSSQIISVFEVDQSRKTVVSGSFVGRVLDVAGGFVTQKIGRDDGDVVRHLECRLSETVVEGDVVDIDYVGETGVVGGRAMVMGGVGR